MAKVNTTFCKAQWCGQKPQALHSERLGSNSNVTTYSMTLGKLFRFSNFYFPVDKIEKIIWQNFCETHKIPGTQFSSTNTPCHTMPSCR